MFGWRSEKEDEDKETCEGCRREFEPDKYKCKDCGQYAVCSQYRCEYCQYCREYKD